jgi:hypothetical protein
MFEMAEMASTELAVPKVVPDIFPPFTDDEEPTESTADDNAVDLSEEMVIEEMPAASPTSARAHGVERHPHHPRRRRAGGDDQLGGHAATGGRAGAAVPPPPERPSPAPPRRSATSPRTGCRALGACSAPTPSWGWRNRRSRRRGPPGPLERLRGRAPGRGPACRWISRSRWPCRPGSPTSWPAPSPAPGDAGGTQAGDRHYWRDQMALASDELAAGKEEGLAGPALAARAVAAARACEQAAQPRRPALLRGGAGARSRLPAGAARPLAPARAGRPRRGGARAAGRAGRAAGDERPAYDTLLAEADGGEAVAARGAPPGRWPRPIGPCAPQAPGEAAGAGAAGRASGARWAPRCWPRRRGCASWPGREPAAAALRARRAASMPATSRWRSGSCAGR